MSELKINMMIESIYIHSKFLGVKITPKNEGN
jgi:hypothetical protein